MRCLRSIQTNESYSSSTELGITGRPRSRTNSSITFGRTSARANTSYPRSLPQPRLRLAAPATAAASEPLPGGESPNSESDLSVWILAPLIFIFLGFDDGQIRRYFIGLVPNRYFELSLTLLDRLDNAIGKYLRGTAMECCLVGLTLGLGLILARDSGGSRRSYWGGFRSGQCDSVSGHGHWPGCRPWLRLDRRKHKTPNPGLNPNDLAIYVLILVGITHVLDNVVFQPFVRW